MNTTVGAETKERKSDVDRIKTGVQRKKIEYNAIASLSIALLMRSSPTYEMTREKRKWVYIVKMTKRE